MITVSLIFWLVQLTSSPVIPLCETPTIDPVKGMLFKSADNGETWSNLDNGLPAEVNAFTFWAGDDTYYLGTSDGLYKGNGLLPVPGWQKAPDDLKGIIGIYPGRDGLYMLSHREGLLQYQSVTGMWNPIDKNLQDKVIHTMVETSKGVIITACESGIYRTNDHGNSWTQVFKGQVTKLTSANGIMLCCSHLGIWRSTDEGENWTRVFTSTTEPFLVQPLGNEWVTIVSSQQFASIWTPNMVFVSADQGLTWNPSKEAFPADLNTIYDIRESGNYRIACSNKGIFRSADDGKTWTQVFGTPQDKGGFFKLYNSGQNLFAMFIDGC